ncbi:Indoleamine 2,3-dioxygenase [Abortiporus biennis]|nr:Indoleamine 2,3-dioxygenase [Abortiporus biennis]
MALSPTETGFSPKDYDVDPHTGFFPPEPLPALPSRFSIWENSLKEAQEVLFLSENKSERALAKQTVGEQWRAGVRSWPVLDTSVLNDNIRYLQKAHMVLAFILHFYAHSIPVKEGESIRIPRSIAVPLVAVSYELGIAPVLTFADTVLWNWELIDASKPLEVENIRYVNLLSGSETERAFYTVSAAVELKGVEMLQMIESFMNLPNVTDSTSTVKINRDLVQLKVVVDELTDIFNSVRDSVDPTEFYWKCRPWWTGGSSATPNGQPKWIFEGVPDYAKLDLAGPSAGQSTVMHALDVFLDVDHKLQHHHRTPAPSDNNKKADTGFMERMRRYMPGPHRVYLQRIGAVSCSVRECARITPSLKEPYNAVVAALKRLRDFHIRIACIYVITKTNSTPPPDCGIDLDQGKPSEDYGRGTGGNHVSSLLKAGRDATHRTILAPDA